MGQIQKRSFSQIKSKRMLVFCGFVDVYSRTGTKIFEQHDAANSGWYIIIWIPQEFNKIFAKYIEMNYLSPKQRELLKIHTVKFVDRLYTFLMFISICPRYLSVFCSFYLMYIHIYQSCVSLYSHIKFMFTYLCKQGGQIK